MSQLEANFNKVRRYSNREKQTDDLRELLAGIQFTSDAITQSIKEAGHFRIFFLGVKFLKDTAAILKGYKVVMDFDPKSGVWTVGHAPTNARRRDAIVAQHEKLDEAMSDILQVWQKWATAEREKESRPRLTKAVGAQPAGE